MLDASAQPGLRPSLVRCLLVVLLAASLLVGLGRQVALSSHESLVAVTARNMAENRPVTLADGSHPSPYLVPNFNGGPRLRKPPLPYWLVVAGSRLGGSVTEWTARLPSALAALGTVLLVAWLVRQEGTWSDAWLAAMALGTMVGFLLMAHRAMADMPLTFFTTASTAALWRACRRRGPRQFGWLVAAGVAAGLGALAKGPVPLLVLAGPALVALGVMLRVRSTSEGAPDGARRWTVAGLALAVLVFLGIALSWPAYVWARIPEAASVWRAESLDRATGDLGHEEPVYFYLLRLPILVLPWLYFFLDGLWRAARRAVVRPGDRTWLLFLGAWLLVPLVGFSTSAGKQDHYLLPVLPVAAIYAGMSMKHLFAQAPEEAAWHSRRTALAHGAAFLLAGIGAVVYVAFVHAPCRAAGALLGGTVAVGGVVAAVLAVRRRLVEGQAVLFAAVLVAFPVAWIGLGGPFDKAGLGRQFARQVNRLVPAEAPVFFYGEANASVIFYADRTIPLVGGPEGLQQAAEGGGPLFVIGRTCAPPTAMTAMRWESLACETAPGHADKGFWLFRKIPEDDRGCAPLPLPAARQARSAPARNT